MLTKDALTIREYLEKHDGCMNLTDKSDGIPSNQLDNMINMIKKIDNSKSQTDIKKIQNQMDTFLKNNFNINLDNFKDLK